MPNLNHNFDDFIGYRGSMRYAIDQISSAIMYPPDGLNILITGHSGVGKSYLASKIAQLAKSKGINGGYLFLDEVHRLSSENQEKLFSFMD